MSVIEKKKLVNIIANCKSELLNHTLQNEVVSPSIKRINSYLDECLKILQKDWEEFSRMRMRGPRVKGEARNNILFFAFCMSKWDFEFVNTMTGRIFNQSEAFDFLAEKLGVRVNTLKNYRDTFDSHVEQKRSSRIGWKKPLNQDFKQVMQEYDTMSEGQLIDIGKEILQGL